MLTFTRRRVRVTALLVSSFFVWANLAQAASTIVINEIGAYETTDHEWIEIYNMSSEEVDITGWKFWENDTNHGLNESQGDLIIEPGEYAIIAQKADIFLTDHSGFNGTIIDSSWGTLKESGEEVGLKDNDGKVVELFTYIEAPNFSLERKDPLLADYTPSNWQEHADSNTVGEQNSNYLLSEPIEEPEDPKAPEDNSTPLEEEISPESNGSKPKILPPQPGEIVISEFVSDPSDGEEEWVELYSLYDYPIDLAGWAIEEGSGAKTKLAGTLGAYTYFVVEKLKGNLNNKGDIIILKDPQEKIIFELTYGEWDDGNVKDNGPVASDPFSVARIKHATQRRQDKNNYQITATPTKGQANYITKPEEKPSQPEANPPLAETRSESSQPTTTPAVLRPIQYPPLQISEFLPDPEGNDHELEFIELFNPNTTTVSLIDWQLDDAEGGSRPFKIATGEIEALSYKVFFAPTTRLTLNNNGDSVRLFNPSSELVDLIEYDKLDTGIAISKIDNAIQQTSTPTPGQPNVITENIEIDESLDFTQAVTSEADAFTAGDKILTIGIVTVPPGILGSKIMYINGLQVYMHKADWPKIDLGDEIQVQGEISIVQNGTRIKLKGKEAIGVISSNGLIEPNLVEVIDIEENLLSQLISISGEVVESKKGTFWVDDETGEIRVVIKSTTNITQQPEVGDMVSITGIVDKTRSGFRLLPRSNDDIVISQVLGEEYAEEISSAEKTISLKKIAHGIGNFFKSLWQRIFN
ncbi:MAG: hypothetical protein COT81_04175 [Candidatus Buchananbacteria bacterium CG10_big_fil_rev_8_21_14_0_10_42_9]|uniref:LTD domain-containing protein n=1 Tax=Candidatus Buchananbacteria bacterium CG10_big_fil_rev_8_21_14_0_10_42_9 TaxID=1974526 RepID=A0A2H0W0C0_9BACT|nr:MAG: hypothetical protein COT81_04175 [Candidatus Buchananbacteria bacterium CG10_big_fil_rev_8_21_14_0_10_42_9]